MSIMYPPQIYSGTKSLGEIEIFNRLQSDPETEGWIVLHSLDMAEHRSQISGEIDFVVIIPEKGILCIEVKAVNSITRDNGAWQYGKNPIRDIRGPFKQASEAMHSLRKKVMDRAPALSKVVFWSCVIFPYISFNEKSPEWHEWQVVDRSKFSSHSISGNLLAVMENARRYLSSNTGARWFDIKTAEPTQDQSKLIANILRPNFEFYESPQSRLSRRKEELKKYSEEQFDALDSMGLNPRVIFQGPAGTGKTLLAMEAARRFSESGEKTLLLCFNRLLGIWLKNEVLNMPNLTTGTLHSHMLSITGGNPPNPFSPAFWEKDLPLLALEKLVEKGASNQFDRLILDESQDLLSPSYLDFLDLSLKGGLSSGKWIFFGDFENQAIYEKVDSIDIQMNSRFNNTPRYSLRSNCRNTPRIAELVHLLGGLHPRYTKIRRPDNQIEPKIITYENPFDQSDKIQKLLEQLTLEEKHTPQEIIILSCRSDGESAANNLSGTPRLNLSPLKSGSKPDKVQYGSIHSFKGMEAPIVILTDVDNVMSLDAQSLFYVGITRALDKLFIFISKKVNSEISKILLES
jgi:DNA polymerase III delta prime subunit